MTVRERKIAISKELSEFILPLSPDEFKQLEKNLLTDGCREPLVVWRRDDGKLVLVDGHNRYSICHKHQLPFKVKTVTFSSLDKVKVWMLNNQMGRRNLTSDQLSYYRGLRYITLKREKGGYSYVASKGKSDQITSEVVAAKFNVSESTIKRDAKFAEGLNILSRSNPKLKAKILAGDAKVKKKDVQTLANARYPEKISIKNEADLYNKAKSIREELLNEVEANIKNIAQEKVRKSQKILQDLEPAFLDRSERVKKIKGKIISAMKKAIDNKDVQAIKDLKELVDKLSQELFD